MAQFLQVRSSGRRLAAGLLVAIVGSSAVAGAPKAPWAGEQLDRIEGCLAWWVPLPLTSIVSIDSYTLLDGYLYAIGTDARVRSIRADTGDYLWTSQVGQPPEKIWPPAAYTWGGLDAAVFTRLNEAVLIDRTSGFLIKRVPLRAPSTTSVATGEDTLYAPSVGRLLWNYSVSQASPRWKTMGFAPILLPPLYDPAADLVVFVDHSGRVHGVDSKMQQRFAHNLDGEPRMRRMAMDATSIYVATTGSTNTLHALDRHTGEPLREGYRLEATPRGGPVVTATSVYQATGEGGLHRIGLTPDLPNWFHRNAKMFLAEWPHSVAVLRNDGKIDFVDSRTGSPAAVFDADRFTDGVSNVWNDAVIVANKQGDIRCIRPAAAKPLTLAGFRPTAASTQPATTRPAAASQPAAVAPEPNAQPTAQAPPP